MFSSFKKVSKAIKFCRIIDFLITHLNDDVNESIVKSIGYVSLDTGSEIQHLHNPKQTQRPKENS